jgi:hypothetical protein
MTPRLTISDAERCVATVTRSGLDWSRESYEGFRFVDPSLPPWEVLAPVLRRSPRYGRYIDADISTQQPDSP